MLLANFVIVPALMFTVVTLGEYEPSHAAGLMIIASAPARRS
jgi:ACR3 family arsenite efflux pump ArsB